MPEKVFLLGEIHPDLDKTGRYERAFAKLKPDVITLEAPSDAPLAATIPSFSKFNDYAVASLCKGARVAAHLYQQSQPGREISLIPVDYTESGTKKLLRELERRSTSEPPTILSASRITQLNALYFSITTSNACGMERINASYRKSNNPAEACIDALFDLAEHGSRKELQRAVPWIDCLYLLDVLIDHELVELGDLEQRDELAVESIARMEGVVAHAGGFAHLFGSYNNLYCQLQTKGIPVERISLLDFTHPDPISLENYKRRLADMAAEVNAEATSILEESAEE